MAKTHELKTLPPKLRLGTPVSGVLCSIIYNNQEYGGERNTILGYRVPSFQRPLVWTEKQNISLVESLILGVNVGTYTVNITSHLCPLDRLLIDGQQRMNAIRGYLNDEFPVFDLFYRDLNPVDKRRLAHTSFPSYETNSTDLEYLKNYYNLMNFSGTPHTKEQIA